MSDETVIRYWFTSGTRVQKCRRTRKSLFWRYGHDGRSYEGVSRASDNAGRVVSLRGDSRILIKQWLQKTVDAQFVRRDFAFTRRAAQADKILDQKLALVITTSRQIEMMREEVHRLMAGRVEVGEIAPNGELKGLTDVYIELRVMRVIIGHDLSETLLRKANLASIVASNWERGRSGDVSLFDGWARELGRISNEISEKVAALFDFPIHEKIEMNPRPEFKAWRNWFPRRFV